MQNISTQELSTLAEKTGELCVSLSFPVDPLNSDPKVNSIAFKNAATQALQQLEKDHKRSDTYQTLLQTSQDLQEDPLFWKEQSKGFVLYVVGTWSKWYVLPVTVPEVVLITDHLYVIPLIAAQVTQSQYYLLELDKEHTCMWQGDSREIRQVTVPDLPESIEEVTGTEMNERSLQYHTGTAAPGGAGRPASYHGNSSWKDDKDRYLERFLQAVDKAIIDFLPERSMVILSGAEELTVLFRQVTNLKNIFDKDAPKVVDSPHKEKNLKELIEKVTADADQDNKKTMITRFEETVPDLKSTDLSNILQSANQGKVDTVMLAEGKQVWGSVDENNLKVLSVKDRKDSSVELLNLTALYTLRTSGSVLHLPKTDMPDIATAAAILRY